MVEDVSTPAVTDSSLDVKSGNVNEVPAENCVAKGKYTLVGVDIDTTGRRLIDEIVQLAAYTPDDHFEQYIMPYMNLNPAARQRHQVRVISIGFYRMLKSMQTYKIIKSKSEIAALRDFLDWLEAIKAKDANSLGIILVYHEERKFIPYMILESLKKYNLLERFLTTVTSFANGLNLAKNNINASLQHYTLRKLSRVLNAKTTEKDKADGKKLVQTDRDAFDGNACVRAKLAFDVALQLSNQDGLHPLDSPDAINNLLEAVQPYAQTIDCDLNELQTQNQNLERQNSFRPVFLNYFKTTLYHRVRAVKFRIILAEQGYDLHSLNAIWSEQGKQGLSEVLQIMDDLKNDDKVELAELFDSFFDPTKVTIKPVVRSNNRRRNRRGGVRNQKNEVTNNNTTATTTTTTVTSNVVRTEQGAGGDKQQTAQSPDSTTKPQNGTGKPLRGRRIPRSRQNGFKGQNRNAETATASTNTTPITPLVTSVVPVVVATPVAVVATN